MTKMQNDFTKVFTVIPDSKSKIKSSAYLESGKYAVIDQGKELVAGYTDTSPTVDEKSLPVIVFGDHTRAVKYVDFPFTAGADGTQILKPSVLTNPKYGFYLLLHAVSKIPSKGYARHFGELKKMQFRLPSLDEQQEIVEKLDSAFAEIDLFEGNLEIGEERSNEMLNSLLNESFTYTSPEEGSYIALSNHEIGARMVQLKDVVSFDKKQGSFDLAYVGLEDIESNTGSHLGSCEPRKVKSNSFAFTSEHLLYGRLRPYLNKVLLPDFDGHCSTEIFPIKVTKDILREYLFYWFRLPSTIEAIDETSTGARMPRANMDAVLEFKISLPPIEKQKEIVQKLDKALVEIDLFKAQIKIERDYVVALRQSLLSNAFSEEEAVV
jgi:type I restriction enzyme S subunit